MGGTTEDNATLSSYHLQRDGVWAPECAVRHREEYYDEAYFEPLRAMQMRHFWYRGRHRFLYAALRKTLKSCSQRSCIDLGGGTGGWIRYLIDNCQPAFREIALADSSLIALETARPFVGTSVELYQIDLLKLLWRDRWDVAFLLDVLEHVPEDEDVLKQIHQILRPGGLLFVTTPALRFFWTYNDDFVGHQRRYARGDFARLAAHAGFELVRARYFMFFLSPLLLASRIKRPQPDMSDEDRKALLRETHRVPSWPVNSALALVFAAETPLGWHLPFPFGTSVLGVFRKY